MEEQPDTPEDSADHNARLSDEEDVEFAEIIELEVREGGIHAVPAVGEGDDRSIAHSAGEMAMSVGLSAVQHGATVGRWLFRKAAGSSPGKLVSDVATGAMSAVIKDADVDWQGAGRLAEEQVGKVIAVVVQSIDPAELMEHIDVNALLKAVDLNALLADIDIKALLERADVNALLEQIDVDALLERVDVAELAKRARIGELVAESTSEVAVSALDLGRRQGVALDTLLARAVGRLLGRDPNTMPPGPPDLIETPDSSI